MSSIQNSYAKTGEAPAALSSGLLGLLAAGAGLSVASIYYSQPMLGVLGDAFGASADTVGMVPMLNQLGYAAGILLLAPLADRYDRRVVILLKSVLLALALLACGLSPSMAWLLATSLAVGLAATLAQDIVPAVAALAPESHRGKAVGTVMTGLFLGILLSRVVSGFVAEQWGWRAMYVIAAVAIAVTGLIAARTLPRFAVSVRMGYWALLASMAQLWRRHAELRRAVYVQGLLSVAFSAFWSTLALMLRDAFGLGSMAAGAFGLAGAVGALAAPLAGKLADTRGPTGVSRLGAMLAAVCFLSMSLAGGLSPTMQLVLLVLATVGFDLGIQASLVANQTLVYGLEPEARSRLNAVLITGMFIGMSLGAWLGSLALSQGGWHGVVALATAAALGAWWLRRR